jgi:hypothetical protein
VVGSQNIPYINEDRVSEKDFLDALVKIYNLSKEERDELGRKGRQHLLKNYNPAIELPKWDELLTKIYFERKNKKSQNWTMEVI